MGGPTVVSCPVTTLSHQVVYIACSFTTVWMIYSKFKATYDGNHDTFRVEFLVVPTAILAFLVNHDFTPLEVGFSGDGGGRWRGS